MMSPILVFTSFEHRNRMMYTGWRSTTLLTSSVSAAAFSHNLKHLSIPLCQAQATQLYLSQMSRTVLS